jgi:hypothetical protein
MIGTLEVEMPGRRLSAALDEDLTWTSDDPQLCELLETISPAPRQMDDQDVAVGRYMLYRAGSRLGARVEVR